MLKNLAVIFCLMRSVLSNGGIFVETATLLDHSEKVSYLWSNKDYFLSLDDVGNYKLWRFDSKEPVYEVYGHRDGSICMLSADYAIIELAPNQLEVVRLGKDLSFSTLTTPGSFESLPVIIGDQLWISLGSQFDAFSPIRDHHFCRFNLKTGKIEHCERNYSNEGGYVGSALSSQNNYLFHFVQTKASVLNLINRSTAKIPENQSNLYFARPFMLAGREYIAIHDKQTVRFFDLANNAFDTAYSFSKNTSRFEQWKVHPFGKVILLQSTNGNALLQPLATAPAKSLENTSHMSMLYSPLGTYIFGFKEHFALVFDGESGSLIQRIDYAGQEALSAAFSEDDRVIIIGFANGNIKLFKATNVPKE